MENISPERNSFASTNNTIHYPTDALQNASAKILASAKAAQSQHEAQWRIIQGYLQSLPTSLQETLYRFFDDYQQQLYASYQWQIDFANTLAQSVDDILLEENSLIQGFTPFIKQKQP